MPCSGTAPSASLSMPARVSPRMSRASRILGWLILAAITAATVVPIGYRR